jgi:response regulator RpfG family c-di-GMP phosphodiesterase
MDRIKLILVDNDPDELHFMEMGFKALPFYEILRKFSNGAELMEFLYDARRLPDLVITDLNVPGKSGIEIARKITLNPNFAYTTVIVLSPGFGDNSFDTKRSRRAGSPFFFEKPSSLLQYKLFAAKLYDKILTDLIHR